MSAHSFVSGCRNEIDKAIAEKSAFLAGGKAESLEAYRSKVGEISGLKKALEIINSMAKRHVEEDSE